MATRARLRGNKENEADPRDLRGGVALFNLILYPFDPSQGFIIFRVPFGYNTKWNVTPYVEIPQPRIPKKSYLYLLISVFSHLVSSKTLLALCIYLWLNCDTFASVLLFFFVLSRCFLENSAILFHIYLSRTCGFPGDTLPIRTTNAREIEIKWFCQVF